MQKASTLGCTLLDMIDTLTGYLAPSHLLNDPTFQSQAILSIELAMEVTVYVHCNTIHPSRPDNRFRCHSWLSYFIVVRQPGLGNASSIKKAPLHFSARTPARVLLFHELLVMMLLHVISCKWGGGFTRDWGRACKPCHVRD